VTAARTGGSNIGAARNVRCVITSSLQNLITAVGEGSLRWLFNLRTKLPRAFPAGTSRFISFENDFSNDGIWVKKFQFKDDSLIWSHCLNLPNAFLGINAMLDNHLTFSIAADKYRLYSVVSTAGTLTLSRS